MANRQFVTREDPLFTVAEIQTNRGDLASPKHLQLLMEDSSDLLLRNIGTAGAPNWVDAVQKDLLSPLVSTEVSITGGTTLTSTALGKMHVLSGGSAALGTSDYTVTLPTAVGNTGRWIGLRVSPAVSVIRDYTIDGSGVQTIDAAATRVMHLGEAWLMMSDGANWVRFLSKTPIIRTVITPISVDLNAAPVAINTWTNTSADQNFWVRDTNSRVRIVVSGVVNAGTAQTNASRLNIDNGATFKQLGGALGTVYLPAQGEANYEPGGLTTGVHTARIQVISAAANTQYCRVASMASYEFLQIDVIETKT